MSPHDIMGPPDQSSRNSGIKFQLARPLTRPNFVALQQKVCEISVVKNFLPAEKYAEVRAIGHQVCHQSIGRTRLSIDTLQ